MFKDELKALYKLVSSSMGPRGHLKMVLSLAGESISLLKIKSSRFKNYFLLDSMIVTSSSDCLFDFMR